MNRLLVSVISGVALVQAGPLTWDSLRISATRDASVQNTDQKIALLQSGPPTKLWDDLEFRYDLDGLGFLEHQFELRLKPAVPGENEVNRRYWQALRQYHAAQREDLLTEALYERYSIALRYLQLSAELRIYQQIHQVNQDRIQVLLALSGSERFNPSDLVESQERDAELQAKEVDLQNTLQEIARRLYAWVPGSDSIALDSGWLPPVENLQHFLEKNPPAVDSSYPQLKKAARKLEASKSRFNLDQVGDKNLIQYIGVGYQWTIAKKEYDYVNNVLTDRLVRKEDNSRLIDRWSVKIGIRIPFFDSKGDVQARRQLDLMDRQSDYLAERHRLENYVAKIREEIGALLRQRQVLQEYTRKLDTGTLFKDFAIRAGTDPLLLLKARESSLQSSLRALRLEFEIYQRYLSLLQYCGFIVHDNTGLGFPHKEILP